MNYLIRKASTYTSEEQAALGITGIPNDWPIEIIAVVDPIPDNYILISDVDLVQLKADNQSAYDAWVTSKVDVHDLQENYKVETYLEGLLQSVNWYQTKDGDSYTDLARLISYTYITGTTSLKQVDNVTYNSIGNITRHEQTKFYTDTDTNQVITETEVI